jgi:hypothetical protein
MRRLLTLAGALLITFAVVTAKAQQPAAKTAEPQNADAKASLWMKQKLAASQAVMAGLTRANFDAIRTNAETMLAVEYLEKWVRADVPNYKKMLNDFEYANRALVLASKEKNLDGATLAYMELTLSCVNCHKIVRDVKK